MKDPICGMDVKSDSKHKTTHEGADYYFCCEGCLKKFEADPAAALTPASEKESSPASSGLHICPMCPEVKNEGPGICPSCGMALEPDVISAPSMKTEWTCPMHPEIIRDEPGACPVCGMSLESRSVQVKEEDAGELVDMRRRLWVGSILTLPVMVAAMSDLIPGRPLGSLMDSGILSWIQLILASPVVLWCGWPFFVRGWQSLGNRSPNMFTLIALGVGVAYVYSLFAQIAPGLFPVAFRSMTGHVAIYFESSAMIIVLVLMGQVMELNARGKTGAAIRALLGLAPTTAHRLLENGQYEEIPLDSVKKGDLLRIRPGEKLPTDGVVVTGESTIDESMLTGEPIPVVKAGGDSIIGGTINGTGTLTMRVDRIGSETLLARIVQMVSEAQRSRAPVQQLADKVASYFVPGVVGISVLTFILWALWGPEPALAYALVNAVAVLIIACPCALGLATPMSIMVAMGRGAHAGVLFKNAQAIELLQNIDVLVVDKTGTLTEGKPTVVSISPIGGVTESELLILAASVENVSEHPLSAAIVSAAEDRSLEISEVVSFSSTTGLGVTGVVAGMHVAVGSESFMKAQGIDVQPLGAQADSLQRNGQSVMYVSTDGQPTGLIGVTDPVKSTTPEAIRALKKDGLEIVMLTGDHIKSAEAVARQLDIKRVMAGALPDQKAELVKQLQAEGHRVAMAGDGINDAPALAQADVGIAMGTGTDVAIETADVALIKGDLRSIARARLLSRATMRNIRQNLFFAFIYNSLGVPVAAGLLYPLFGILLSPMLAAVAMSFSSVSVIMNALRLRGTRLGSDTI